MDGKDILYWVDPLKATEQIAANVVQKLKTLRLEALRSNTSAYVSTLEREEKFTDSEWEAHILDPKHHYLICHTSPQTANDTRLDNEAAADEWVEKDAWVGMLLLLGPYPKDEYGATRLLSSTAMGPEEEETRWHLTALYLQPKHRCEDSAIAVHEAILDYLTIWTNERLETLFDHATGLEKPKRARVAGVLASENDQLRVLYEALAGQSVGWADGALGHKIVGIEDLPDVGSMGGLCMRVMERVIEC
ncbi:MAG: hypothetical protein Q9201_002875 [Fulgogasparrea decipioides]